MQKEFSPSFEKFISNLKIGDLVNFPLKGAFLKVKGEVRDFYFDDNQFYIILYSFFKRRELAYVLTEDLSLITPRKRVPDPFPESAEEEEEEEEEEETGEQSEAQDPIFYYNFRPGKGESEDDIEDDGTPAMSFFNNAVIKKTLAIIMILALIYPLIHFLVNPLFAFLSTAYSYEEFLNKNFSLADLGKVVNLRIQYKSDFSDEWHTPAYAWEKRLGDCEEMAALCAAYLNFHHIDAYLVGLTNRVGDTGPKSNQGHAVVFIKGDKQYSIIDPTRAIEPAGFKTFTSSVTSLRQAIQLYASLPAVIYKIPVFNGNKEVLDLVY